MNPPDASLRTALADWTRTSDAPGRSRWPAPISEGFQPVRAVRAAERVKEQLGDRRVESPSLKSLDDLYWRAVESLHRGTPLQDWPRRDLRQLPWVFFHTPTTPSRVRRSAPPDRLGDSSRFVRSYGVWLTEKRRPRPVLSLLHEFLRVYPTESQSFDRLRRVLTDAILAGNQTSSLRRWRERCETFPLLGPGDDLAFVASLVASNEPVTQKLEEAGFDASLATAGFLKSGLAKELSETEKRLKKDGSEPDRLERLLEILEFGGGLRFDDLRKTIAESLLRPFLQREADAPTRERILAFLMRHFGHPNLPAGRRNWRPVSMGLRNVVLKWLVEQSLDAFFAVVKETALDRHWKYRERFWKAHFDAGLIDRAWFVLGSRARGFMERNAEAELSMGTLHGSEGRQSVLLLHLTGSPGMTVAEWSHSGACRIWNDGNPDAPELYQSEYSRHGRRGRQLTQGENHRQTHHGSESGRWQDQMAEWIGYYTDVAVRRSDYLPPRTWDAPLSPTRRIGRESPVSAGSRKQSRKTATDRRWERWRRLRSLDG